MSDPWAEDAPIRRRNPGCLAFVAIIVVGALVISAVASFVESLAVTLALIVVVVATAFGAVAYFRRSET